MTRPSRARRSPNDGTRIVTGAADGTVGVWDVATGAELFLAAVHGDYTNAVSFLPGGRTVSAGDDRLVLSTCDTCGPINDVVTRLEQQIADVPEAPPFAQLETMSTLEIVAGTCLGPLGGESITQITPVPCDEPHQAEVYAVLRLPDPPGGDMPVDIYARSDRLCRDGYYENYRRDRPRSIDVHNVGPGPDGGGLDRRRAHGDLPAVRACGPGGGLTRGSHR